MLCKLTWYDVRSMWDVTWCCFIDLIWLPRVTLSFALAFHLCGCSALGHAVRGRWCVMCTARLRTVAWFLRTSALQRTSRWPSTPVGRGTALLTGWAKSGRGWGLLWCLTSDSTVNQSTENTSLDKDEPLISRNFLPFSWKRTSKVRAEYFVCSVTQRAAVAWSEGPSCARALAEESSRFLMRRRVEAVRSLKRKTPASRGHASNGTPPPGLRSAQHTQHTHFPFTPCGECFYADDLLWEVECQKLTTFCHGKFWWCHLAAVVNWNPKSWQYILSGSREIRQKHPDFHRSISTV